MAPAPLVSINGFPGTGKLTVAQELQRLCGAHEAVLIDNHQLIDIVESRIPRTHPDYASQRKKARSNAFSMYVENTEMSNKVIIFTGQWDFHSPFSSWLCQPVIRIYLSRSENWDNIWLLNCLDFQSDSELGSSVAEEYEICARRSGRQFFPISITCSVSENLERIIAPERVAGGTGKLLSTEMLQDMRSRCELFQFGVPDEFNLDNTHLSPTVAAEMIFRHMNSWLKPRWIGNSVLLVKKIRIHTELDSCTCDKSWNMTCMSSSCSHWFNASITITLVADCRFWLRLSSGWRSLLNCSLSDFAAIPGSSLIALLMSGISWEMLVINRAAIVGKSLVAFPQFPSLYPYWPRAVIRIIDSWSDPELPASAGTPPNPASK